MPTGKDTSTSMSDISLILSPTPSTYHSEFEYIAGITSPTNLIFIPLVTLHPAFVVYVFLPKISVSTSIKLDSSIFATRITPPRLILLSAT